MLSLAIEAPDAPRSASVEPLCDRIGAHVIVKSTSLCLTLLLSFPVMAQALNLRGVDVGDSCRKAIEAETQHGLKSRRDPEQSLQFNHTINFEGIGEGGEKTQTHYQCADDDRTIELISVTLSPADAPSARTAFARAKAEIRSKLGPAAFDTESAGLWGRIRIWRAAAQFDAVDELASWAPAPDLTIYLSLTKDRASGEWQMITMQSRPHVASQLRSTSHLPAVPMDALILAVLFAAIVAAMVTTHSHVFRWPIVIAVSLALSYTLYWLPTWRVATSVADSVDTDPSFPALLTTFIACVTIAAWIVRALGQRRASPHAIAPSTYMRARLFIQIACGLLIALGFWLHWLFRPGQETNLRAGQLTLGAVLPFVVLLATVLAYRGVTRLLQAPRRFPEHTARMDIGCVVAGALILILIVCSLVQDVVGTVVAH